MTSLWLLQVNFVGSLEWIHQLSGALPVIRNVFTDNFFYNLYKILSALQDWQNFAKIATFAKFAVFSNLPTFRGRSTWVNLFALIISPTTFAIGKILLKSPLSKNSPFSPTLWGPFNWLYLFPLIISSTTLAKFCQNRHFRHCLHLWTYLIWSGPLSNRPICPGSGGGRGGGILTD